MSDIYTELVGKVFHVPVGTGKEYMRLVMRSHDHGLLYFFPLRISYTDDGGVLVGRWTTASQPITRPMAWFDKLPDDAKTPIEVALPSCTNLLRDALSDEQKAAYDAVLKRLQVATDPEKLMLSVFHRTYNPRLEGIARAEKVSRLTVAREVATYFQVGMDAHKAAMLQIFGTRKEKAVRTVPKCKRGRKKDGVKAGHYPPDDRRAGINVTGDHIEQIEMFIRSQPGDLSKAELYRRYEEAHIHRTVGTLECGTAIKQRDPGQDITYGQFAYYLGKLQAKREREIAKVGRVKFSNNHRALIGTARDGILYPGQCYIIDATTADIYLVSAVNRKLLIGRPIIYVVIDAFSSMILAVHVTLETANGDQAKVALYRALTPKDKFLQQIGRPTLLQGLLAGVIPQTIFADRGEVFSEAFRGLVEALKIGLDIAAPYMANWKSLVERYFGVQNTLCTHWIPGAVRERMKERGTRDVRYDAVMTLQGMQRLMNSLAAEWNLTHDMSKHASCQMLRREIEATPISFWNYGLNELHASPRYLDRSDAIRQFLPTVNATINRLGIHATKHLRFTADWMKEDNRLYELRGEAGCQLFLDPDSPFGAFFPDPDTGDLSEVELVDLRNYHDDDVVLDDIRMMEEYVPFQQSDTQPPRDNIVATERGYRSSVIREEARATKAAKAEDTRSKAAQTAGIAINRRIDRALGKPVPDPSEPQKPSDLVNPATGWGKNLDNFFS